jgi:hypothetical protein
MTEKFRFSIELLKRMSETVSISEKLLHISRRGIIHECIEQGEEVGVFESKHLLEGVCVILAGEFDAKAISAPLSSMLCFILPSSVLNSPCKKRNS